MARKRNAQQAPADKVEKSSEPQQATQPKPEPFEVIIGLSAALLSIAALASSVSQSSLSPVYGSIPASRFHSRGILYTSLLAFVGKGFLRRRLPRGIRYHIPVLGYYIPMIQWVLFTYSGKLGPVYGPLATEALTFYPFLLLSVHAAGVALDDLDLSMFSSTAAEMLPTVGSFLYVTAIEKITSGALPSYMGSSDFFTRSGLQLFVASISAILAPSRALILAAPAMLFTMKVNPHHPAEYTTELANRTLQNYNYTLLERKESLTGYVSVLESQNDGFRVLRCDHSLLGGEWLVTEKSKDRGQTGPESIYSVFTMLESIRLVEREQKRADSESSALMIGLGIGTSQSAFIRHGINTTIVELDPIVHYFATKYFDLPTNHTAALVDAIGFVDEHAVSQPESFDYIVHDVFTGGAEPAALFTLEFLDGLKRLLRDDGVVAINYAGDLGTASPKLVIGTILTVFPSCRIFRDMEPEAEPTDASEFINMVVICVKTPSAGDGTIQFRRPTPQDWLGSLARRQFIPPKPELEIPLGKIFGEENEDERRVLRRGGEAELEAQHVESAEKHWRIMRGVLPNEVWELW
ncbi:spermine/spermidine synthase family protein [Aulographum hederae CBS 113979]|uniref:Spermine/spermidine synthase family protein n=1 Tax=Aulographum hederae CBS 113979 TaxID=1176131 RepID=A0A6G1GXD5_9PEZI|nr:spermine/spermidine synthase family protein [Aulographum hederae CBS 113979]